MAGHETRMLLLGAVSMFAPVNGYQIRRELLSWHVDEWAHVNPGSIYHGLATLTRQELLVRTDLLDGAREVAVYEITDAGRAELQRLQVEALERVDLHDRVAFQAAFGMLSNLGTATAVGALRTRAAGLEGQVEALAGDQHSPYAGPPHARRGLVLWRELAIAELLWLRGVLADLESGALRIAPDQWDWAPPADDEGWQMQADREKYRALLGR
ncbi:PadR family transcriptional regulator [Nocardioides campestrisoli]|uniref:PadR family transcriptional regulator n=1 Tax=Nocardioides campestrisoli TaxID=2736757 RepID=UPI0015E7DE99|nr:PadR family transcriptional regulator [Nocardioides campestrisoli]